MGALKKKPGEIVLKFSKNGRVNAKKLKALKLESNFSFYKRLADESCDGIICIDRLGNYIYANAAYANLLEVKREELIGKGVFQFYESEEAEKRLRLIEEACENGERLNTELKYQTKQGVFFFIASLKTMENTAQGREIVACTYKDISELKRVEEEARERESLLHRAQIVARMGSYTVDLEKDIHRCTRELDAILGIDEAYPHTTKGWIDLVHPEWRAELTAYKAAAEVSHSTFDLEYKIIRPNDKEERWVHGLGEFRYDESGRAVQLIGTLQDITGRKKAEEEILYLSYHDKLTGVYNRRFYEEMISKLDIERNLPLTVIMGDVNGLKLINDAFGHIKGDELLEKAVSVMKRASRKEDIVIRWGGDEFIILLKKEKKGTAKRIVEKINHLCENEFINGIALSISFGYATKTQIEEDIVKIFKNAEDRMYNAKIVEKQVLRGKVIYSMITRLHKENGREQKHSEQVCELSRNLGIEIGLSEGELNKLELAAYLHDIGKIAIHEDLINKRNKLNNQEEIELKRHSDIGYRILSSSYNMLELADYIYTHHERWDGNGYPKKLEGEEIPVISRIIAIAEAYDTLISEQPYRQARSKEEALLELKKNAGTQFDPEMIQKFEQSLMKKPCE